MKRKTIGIILASAMVVGSLAGCGSSAAESATAASSDTATNTSTSETASAEATSETTATTEKAASGEKTKIVFQTWNPSEENYDALEAAFEEANPDIDIEFKFLPYADHVEKLKVDLAAGDAADVYGMQTGATYEEFRDYEADLSPYVKEQYGDDWESEYNDYCMSLLKADDGEYYALPLGLTYAGFAWSDDAFLNKYGLSISENEKLDDLKKVCQTLRDNGEYPLAIGAKDAWINIDTWMNIANDINSDKLYSALDGKTSFEDADLIQSLKIWQDCFTEGVFQDGALGVGMYTDTTDLFQKEGSIPMILNGSWACGAFLDSDEGSQKVYNSDDSHHTAFLIDWNNDGKAAPVQASVDVCLCMNKNSAHADEAYRFIDWMLHDGQDYLINQKLQYCPSRTDLELNVNGLSDNGKDCLNFIVKQSESNVGGYREMPYADLKQAITDNLSTLALGDETPEEAASAIQSASEAQAR